MEEANAFIVTIRSFTTPFASGCATEPVDNKQETTIREDERIFRFVSFEAPTQISITARARTLRLLA